MPKVIIRSGGDWLEVSVDGDVVIENHSGGPSDWKDVLEKCGIEVDYDSDGDFCADCGEWTKKTKKGPFGDRICMKCAENPL